MEPLISVEPASPPAYAASASDGGGLLGLPDSVASPAGASSGDAKTQGATKKKRKRGPRAAGAGADADGVDGGGGGGKRSSKKKKAEAAAAASEGKGATAGGGKRGAAASAKADGKRQQQKEKQQQQQQEEKREPGILAPQYAPKRQDLGADHEAIFALIKAVVKSVSLSMDRWTTRVCPPTPH